WDGNPFSRSFDTLYDAQRIISNRPLDARHVPLVVVNGTIVEAGTRITVSPPRPPPAFKGDVENAFDHRDAPMRMSTTALMSARFTYVSPAGAHPPRGARGRRGLLGEFGGGDGRAVVGRGRGLGGSVQQARPAAGEAGRTRDDAH